VPFPPGGLYGGTFVLDVPADAGGTFTVWPGPPPHQTSLKQMPSSTFMGLIATKPTRITIACPQTPQPEAAATVKNRYLSFEPANVGARTAVRVTFESLPPPYDAFTGRSLWLSGPRTVSENAGKVNPAEAPGFPTFTAATLACDAFFADWGRFGTVQVFHHMLVPGGRYSVQIYDPACSLNDAENLSAPVQVSMGRWGDVAGLPLGGGAFGPPDARVDIISDAIALLNKFNNRPNALPKARCDIQPALPDLVIDIVDVSRAIDAFRGMPYPFPPAPWPCGGGA
jgi:hypothetical protein